MAQQKLVQLLEEIAKNQWDNNQSPILLSNLPPLILSKNPNFKSELNGLSLKSFISKEEASHAFKLIQHPEQKEKLGIIPKIRDYKFPDSPIEPKQISDSIEKDKSSEKTLLDFLKLLKKLPSEDLHQIELPISILVKFVK